MILKHIAKWLLPMTVFLVACDKTEVDIEPPVDDSEEQITDLSEKEMANCYIVQQTGKFMFKADNQFNLGENLPVPPVISPVKAELVWQTVPGSVVSVDLTDKDEEPYVEFEVSKAEGNALIAVLDKNGDICWSWHIWMPSEDVMAVKAASGYEVMNMNLGALNNTPGDAASYGVLYQWGRKDPFPAAATLTGNTTTVSAPMYDMDGNSVSIQNSDWNSIENNTLLYSIAHPTVCLSNMAQYGYSRDWLKSDFSDDFLWGNATGKKTCYDPSPAGWRVAPSDVFTHFTMSGGYEWDVNNFNVWDANGDGLIDLDDYAYGWFFMINEDTPMYFPAAARFDGSYAMLMGSVSGIWGNYWSCTPSSSMAGGAVGALAFQVKDQNGHEMISVAPSGVGSRADAYSIRCIKDK